MTATLRAGSNDSNNQISTRGHSIGGNSSGSCGGNDSGDGNRKRADNNVPAQTIA